MMGDNEQSLDGRIEDQPCPSPVPSGTLAPDSIPQFNTYFAARYSRFGKSQLDSHLLERAALELGLRITRISPLIFIAEDRIGQRTMFSSRKSTLSTRTAIRIARDKDLTRRFLVDAEIPVAPGRLVDSADPATAIRFALTVGYPVVVKPPDGKGGRDIMTDLSSPEQVRWAFEAVRRGAYAWIHRSDRSRLS